MTEAKQIDKITEQYIKIPAFTANGSSDDITSALTSVLTTAGAGGISVPLQIGSTTSEGVNTSAIVNILKNSSNRNVLDTGSSIVYGKLTVTSGVYTLTYFSTNAYDDTEGTHSFPTSTTIDIYIKYFFTFGALPNNSVDRELLIHKINSVYGDVRVTVGF